MANSDVLDLVPAWRRVIRVSAAELPDDWHQGPDRPGAPGVLGVPITSPVHAPAGLGPSAESLTAAGFDGTVGQALTYPADDDGTVVLFGVGVPHAAGADELRDAGAAFANAATRHSRLALVVPQDTAVPPERAAQALVEGVLLARYRYPVLKTGSGSGAGTASGAGSGTAAAAEPLPEELLLLAPADRLAEVARGAERGRVLARTQSLARDLATCPPSIMTAAVFADCAVRLAAESGFDAEVFDRAALEALGCGGLLGVNAGSADEPRMVKLSYRPAGDPNRTGGTLALVGKGIMYDSGGISLKPSDAVHATMKNDMSGAGAILAAATALRALDCRSTVTGWLMCTDNMPSGSATKLGDVLTFRGGGTCEVVNTDAEGRLVMADALVLATEEPGDAIVDIATLTGASMRALGAEIAGVFGNDEALMGQVLAAAAATGEPTWQLPLAHRYRAELDSDVADIKNMGGPNGGAIHAALFLEEYVAGRPWAHIDIAGPAQNDTASGWRPRGCTGFGARLLTELALGFTAPTGASA